MYSPEEIETAKETILNEIELGKGLAQIIKEHKLPCYKTVMQWLREGSDTFDSSFLHNYTRARENQADYLSDEIVDISDTEPDPAKARVRIDARKWKASKLKPKVYGDRVINENQNKNYNVELTDEELDAKIERLKKQL